MGQSDGQRFESAEEYKSYKMKEGKQVLDIMSSDDVNQQLEGDSPGSYMLGCPLSGHRAIWWLGSQRATKIGIHRLP